ncbi:MAG: hypothetical protein IT228_04295 [Flavobacteriales bacterium]|nr:hypothetical protein [Flavobacteriales bacterium]MCC6576544.1 hypothetical protein [Flavobacteriales bacterium]NUQ15684.1 hypothetical protein [Flavobacteriales bacterium]
MAAADTIEGPAKDPSEVAGVTPNNVVNNVYSAHDVNMNGQVKYAGPNNDRDPILVNIGGTTPNSTRTEQLP